jgi:hypothetical protein
MLVGGRCRRNEVRRQDWVSPRRAGRPRRPHRAVRHRSSACWSSPQPIQIVQGTLPEAGPGAAPLLRLRLVFDPVRKPQPRMSSFLPDRPRRRREGRIGECAHRDGHNSRQCLRGVEDGRAAVRTEVEDALSTVRDADVLTRDALGRHLLCVESRLHTEDASGSTLAGETVADRDPQRLALDREPELLAATRSVSSAHRLISLPHAGPAERLTLTVAIPDLDYHASG